MSSEEASHSVDPSRAVAYLKAAVTDHSGDALTPSFEDSPVVRDLGNGLAVTYVVDQGDHFHFVQQRHLRQSGISEEVLHKQAVENLANFCRLNLQVQKHSQIFAFLCGGNFEASLLLVDGLWDKGIAHAIAAPYIAAIPARDMLAVCSAESRDGIRELREVVSRVTPGGNHLLTTSLYIRESGKWRAYELGEGSAGGAT
jgi:uncharacterized protein YtpQ (UPF0354 family)